MNCYLHDGVAAVGLCSFCQKAVCRRCIAREAPRLVCAACAERGTVMGFGYRSEATIAGWPLVHICTGLDAVTMRPKVAKGIIAIGNIAVGGIAVAGLSFGVVAMGGLSVGLLLALGGAALGLGLSLGGLAVGRAALGGLAVGFQFAVGGAAFAPAIIDGQTCDAAARDFFLRWLGASFLPAHCR